MVLLALTHRIPPRYVRCEERPEEALFSGSVFRLPGRQLVGHLLPAL